MSPLFSLSASMSQYVGGYIRLVGFLHVIFILYITDVNKMHFLL
jgi:hypothetical protein